MTGIFMDTGQSRNRFETSFAEGPGLTAGEMFELSRENTLRQNLSTSKLFNMEQTYDERIDKFEQVFGKRLPNPLIDYIPEAGLGPENFERLSPAQRQKMQMGWFEEQINKGRNSLPENERGTIITFEEMQALIPESARARDKSVRDAQENVSTAGFAAGIAGDLTAFMQDPLILATLPIAWPSLAGRATLQAMARVGLSEALIAAGSEALIQPIVQEFRRELGFEDAGFESGLRNVIFAAGGGAVLGGGLAGLSKQGEKFLKFLGAINSSDSRVLAKELRAQPNPSKADEALAGQLEKDANQVDDNPLWQGPEEPKPLADIDKPPDEITELDITAREMRAEAGREHDARTIEADKVAEDGGLPAIPEEPAVPPAGRVIIDRADNAQSTAELVDPNTLNIDAKRFQFKSLTEEVGVTPRLKDVGEWDQTKAGLTLIWEDESGARFIADGHQRTALAKRLLKEQAERAPQIPKLVNKRAFSGHFTLGFDANNPIPTKDQLKKGLEKANKDIDVDVTQFDPNIVSVGRGSVNFRIDVFEKGTARLVGEKRTKKIAESFGPSFFGPTAKTKKLFGETRTRFLDVEAQTPRADIKLLGIIRKEVDGFTAEDVMVEAAMKNIAETDLVTPQLAIDAAKVMRIRPEDITELLKSLPPRSTMVKTVSGLINLSDRSFSHVINQKVSATHAAMVARLVKEENLQDAIMDVLVREQVVRKTDIEAEAIIRQAREVGTRTEIQESLFGKEVLETSLFSERAKVLQKTLQKLRKEKSVFRNLVKNKGKIESEGNALKTDINQQIADESAVAVELLMKLANRTGALSNALSDAARQAGETKQFGPAVDQFIDSVREAITRGDFEGVAVGGVGRAVENPAQNRKDSEQRTAARDVEEVEGFDEGGPGAEGPEIQSRIFDEELAAIEADPTLAEKKIPVEFTDPNTGKSVSSSITLKEIAQEAKDDDGFLNGLAGCLRGK